MPLFTNFRAGQDAGLFDWYTGLVGLFAVTALASHGALYLVWRTAGEVHSRSLAIAGKLWRGVGLLWTITTIATASVHADVFTNLLARLWSLACALVSIGGFCLILVCLKRRRELEAFLCSCAFLLGLMGATMIGIYPHWLRSTIDPAYSLTAANPVAASYGLEQGLIWWTAGTVLTVGYFFFLYRSLRAKVEPDKTTRYTTTGVFLAIVSKVLHDSSPSRHQHGADRVGYRLDRDGRSGRSLRRGTTANLRPDRRQREPRSSIDRGDNADAGRGRRVGRGFLFTEGIVRRKEDIIQLRRTSANEVVVSLVSTVAGEFSRLERQSFISSSCGVCGKRSIASVFARRAFVAAGDKPHIEPTEIVAWATDRRPRRCCRVPAT
ncbi:MAG TPA: cytochrome d ubiquinol oxidase subunit II [Pirellulales bacterium]|nr:cytochrome d ubiquinol oxidase subunit II [Pirellulales bacterium]